MDADVILLQKLIECEDAYQVSDSLAYTAWKDQQCGRVSFPRSVAFGHGSYIHVIFLLFVKKDYLPIEIICLNFFNDEEAILVYLNITM